MLMLLLTLYIVGVLTGFIGGLIFVICFCDAGRECEECRWGLYFIKYAAIFPIAIYKFIKIRLSEAENE